MCRTAGPTTTLDPCWGQAWLPCKGTSPWPCNTTAGVVTTPRLSDRQCRRHFEFYNLDTKPMKNCNNARMANSAETPRTKIRHHTHSRDIHRLYAVSVIFVHAATTNVEFSRPREISKVCCWLAMAPW